MKGQDEIKSILDAQKNSGFSIAAFCARENIPKPTFYGWRTRFSQEPAPVSANPVEDALRVLRQHGFRIPKALRPRSMPAIKHRDLRNFKRWAIDAFSTRTRFVVGWGGTSKTPHLVFHTLEGLKCRQEHAQKIRALNGDSNGHSGN